MSDGFPGERPEHQMRKLVRSNAAVTCGSCRQFDGLAWCRRWNFHTGPSSPICDQYRPIKQSPPEKDPLPTPPRKGEGS
jgi:hypothetical protein